MIGRGMIACHHTRHKVAHIAHYVRILVDINRVLVKLIAAPQLRQLTASNGELVVYVVTHHHNIGSLSKVVKALTCRRLI